MNNQIVLTTNIVNAYLWKYPQDARTGIKKTVSMFVSKVVHEKMTYLHRIEGTQIVTNLLRNPLVVADELNAMQPKAIAEIIHITKIQAKDNKKASIQSFSSKTIQDIEYIEILTLLVEFSIKAAALQIAIEKGANKFYLKMLLEHLHMTKKTKEYAESSSRYRSYIKTIKEMPSK